MATVAYHIQHNNRRPTFFMIVVSANLILHNQHTNILNFHSLNIIIDNI